MFSSAAVASSWTSPPLAMSTNRSSSTREPSTCAQFGAAPALGNVGYDPAGSPGAASFVRGDGVDSGPIETGYIGGGRRAADNDDTGYIGGGRRPSDLETGYIGGGFATDADDTGYIGGG